MIFSFLNRNVWLVVFMCGSCTVLSQRISDSLDFRNPVDIPLLLSGNFGEFRSNHFHTGIDIKTNGKTGYPVYAIADGWIRRVKTGPFSYGKVLYVDHPSGHTSVYAHLNEYNDTISSFLELAQKTLKRNEVDVFPSKNRLPVMKGELLGYTGNTGRSGGPHLHFEVRTSDTEKPLNPLLLGFKVKDNVPPRINGLLVENFSDSLRGKVVSQKRYYAQGSAKTKKVVEVVKISSQSGLAVHALDYLTGSSNSCGIYSVRMFLDDELTYSMKLDSLDFSVGRYINAHKVYPIFKSDKSSFHRCYKMPNNKLPIYSGENDGLIRLTDSDLHKVRIEVEDAALNLSTLTFNVQLSSQNITNTEVSSQYVLYDEASSIVAENCSLRIPPYRLVNDELISIEKVPVGKKRIADYFQVGDESVPLLNSILLSIKVNEDVKADSSKIFITRYNPKNGHYYSQSGEYKDGWVKTRIKQFGVYTLDVDSVAPSVTWSSSSLTKSKKISIKITDDNSGISRYGLEIDGEWIPLYYNYKVARLEGILPRRIKVQTHPIYRLEVGDERKNKTVLEGTI